jgi:hypothetical protein
LLPQCELAAWLQGFDTISRMKYWEIIADNAGWSMGYVSAIASQGRTIWIVDAHRDDGKRFIMRADEKLTAFVELEAAIRGGDFVLTRCPDFFKKAPR